MKVVVSTLGRCGSKYLLRNLRSNNITLATTWNHMYPNKIANKFREEKDLKVIFLYTDPCEIVLSVKKREKDISLAWVEKHFKNLRADFNEYSKIMKKDSLKLERMFDEFYKRQKFDLLTLRYEAIEDNLDIIEKFLDMKFVLDEPFVKREPRLNKLDKETRLEMLRGYSKFRNKVIGAEDAKIWNKI